jgi:RND family efflux transporter MFP subunit
MALTKEPDEASAVRLERLRRELAERREQLAALTERWHTEKEHITKISTAKEELERLRGEAERAERDLDLARASELRYGRIPELEQQLAAATAALATAQAQRNLSAVTARRWGELASRNVVSQQAEDERRGDLAAREAMMAEATANVNRLRALLGFNRLVAPFDGTVTSRATEVGALIVAGDTRSPPLFTISDKSRLRIYVRVPQAFAGAVAPGLKAQFTVPDRPDRVFGAELERSADAVDVQSGTMLVQLVADNAEGLLKPGSYAQVRLELPPSAAAAAVRVPASALIFRREGTAVAVVNSEGVVEIRPVRIAQDLGAELEIDSGLSLGDWIIDSPSDAIRSGDRVRMNRPG